MKEHKRVSLTSSWNQSWLKRIYKVIFRKEEEQCVQITLIGDKSYGKTTKKNEKREKLTPVSPYP